MKIILIVQHGEDDDNDIEKLQQKQLQEMLARMAMPEVSYDHSSSSSYSNFVVCLTLLEMYHLILLNLPNFILPIMILIISHVIKGFEK